MMGKIVRGMGCCILLVLFLFSFTAGALAQVKPPEGAVKAAGEYLEHFKQSIKSGTEFKKFVREGEDANDLTLVTRIHSICSPRKGSPRCPMATRSSLPSNCTHGHSP